MSTFRFSPRRLGGVVMLTGLGLSCWLGGAVQAGGEDEPRIVLMLYPDVDDGRPGNVLVNQIIRSTFARSFPKGVEVHSEHLDLTRFNDAENQRRLAEALRQKYAGRKIEVVIAGLATGLDFALTHRDRAFPGAPIVFCAVDEREVKARKLPPDVIGVPIRMDLAATLDLALQLHPRTRRVYVVTGKSSFDFEWRDEARRIFQAFQPRVEFTYLSGQPMDELVSQVAELPQDSLIYYVHMFEDGDGKIVVPSEVLKRIAEHASVPIYGHVDTYVGRGIVGGHVFSFASAGQDAAVLGVRIVAGERAERIGVQAVGGNKYLFDWRQLQRWGIRESSLPAGSLVELYEPSFWDLYHWHIVGVLSLCVVETLFIVGLLVQRASRRKAVTMRKEAEGNLRRSQEQLRELTGRLLQTQEAERRRIARELHDDLNQNLAMLAIELDLLNQQPPENGQLGGRLQELSARVKELSSIVHDLSHQLHPAKLEQLGLVPALKSYCKELSQSHGLTIVFKDDGVPAAIASDTALCLYRIAQEALHNVVRHSGAQHAAVEIHGDGGHIRLRILDDGQGFDSAAPDDNAGLGLVSMRERLRTVQGEIVVQSRPGAGACIEVRVPVPSDIPPASREIHLEADASSIQ